MALLTKIEAAISLGIGMELLERCCSKCLKHGEDRILPLVHTDQGDMIDEKELDGFRRYLNDPWPLSKNGTRPSIPEVLKEDIRRESHLSCAICGYMDNGEVAHIEAVADSLNNSPDNLIYLCPNHHTKYDLGYKPSSNVTEEEVRAAKLIKRRSRRRMMRCEDNVTKALTSLLNAIAKIQEELKKNPTANMVSILETEVRTLLEMVPELSITAQGEGQKDVTVDASETLLREKAPSFAKATLGIKPASTSKDVRDAVTQLVDLSEDVLIDLDEVDCPRCGGRGMTGLIGDLCAYCKGSCVVSSQEAEEYDPEDIDEVECPHCSGRGVIGLDQHWCPFCRGSCFVSRNEADDYDEHKIDEVDCPHCNGSGILGYDQHYCPYCHGACRISKTDADDYDEDEIDEVDCPHCNGRGVLGYNQHYCPYCHGACRISKTNAENYDEHEIDEVNCPHCNGSGTVGLIGDTCKLCRGASVVSTAVLHSYYEKYSDR